MPPLSVTDIVSRLKHAVEQDVGAQSVVGEIGSCKQSPSNHLYFTLRDANAQLQCVLYSFRSRGMRLQLREGMQVEVYGKASVWEPRGSLQFIVERVQERGVGTLQQQFEALKRKLMAEGLFDESRKRDIPAFPQSVGLITSATGAVIQDMRHRLEARAPWMHAYLFPVQVQGRGAELGLARALEMMGHPEQYGLPRVDYLVLARGGGSLEDLWCFNEECLARAIAACPIPVVSAVGHETDFTIADFVADLRAPTPTAAIELTTPDAAEISAWLDDTAAGIRRRLRQTMEMARLRLRAAEQGKLSRPMELLAPFHQRLDAFADDISAALHNRLVTAGAMLGQYAARISTRALQQRAEAARARLDASERLLSATFAARMQAARAKLDTLAARLEAASPQAALQRGFALVQTADGSIARNAAALSPGDALTISLGTGKVDASVTAVHPQ